MKRTIRVLSLGLCFASCFASSLPVYAGSDRELISLLSSSLEELMTMTASISTSTKQTLSKAPSVVSVITAEDLRLTGATNLMEALQSIPGIYVRANQFGYKPLISIRGAAGTASLLMINGEPIKDLVWSPAFFWKGIPAEAIERVEIIRGPGSALYGSDASSGVINVVTRTAGQIQGSEAGVRAGSFNTRTGWVRHGTEWNGFDIGLTAHLTRTDGHDARIGADAQTARDAAAGTNASYAPGRADYGWSGADVRFSAARGNWRLLADHMSHRDVAVGLTGAGVLDPRTRGTDSQTSLALLYDNREFARDWALNAELRYRDMEYSSGDGFYERPPGFNCTNALRYCNGGALGVYAAGLINQMSSAERRTSGELSGLYGGFAGHALRIGGGFVRQDLYAVEHRVNYGLDASGAAVPLGSPLVDISASAYAFAPERVRRIGYFFVQDAWSFADDWELTAGVRHDHYSDFGGATTPRAALVWQTTERLTTKLMYGEAFRAPTYLELYARTAATNPNPGLRPERSKTTELAFSYAASRNLQLGLNLFTFRQSDLVALDSTSTYQNANQQRTRGVELEAHWQATNTLRLSGSVASRSQMDMDLIQRQVPDHEAYLRMDWSFMPKWHLNLQANWAGKRTLAPTDKREPLPGYTLADATLRYFHGSEWEFAASIRNIFDKDVREYTGTSIPGYLPQPGRNAFAEIRYKFF